MNNTDEIIFVFKSMRLVSPIDLFVSVFPNIDILTLDFLRNVGAYSINNERDTTKNKFNSRLTYLPGYAFVDDGVIINTSDNFKIYTSKNNGDLSNFRIVSDGEILIDWKFE